MWFFLLEVMVIHHDKTHHVSMMVPTRQQTVIEKCKLESHVHMWHIKKLSQALHDVKSRAHAYAATSQILLENK